MKRAKESLLAEVLGKGSNNKGLEICCLDAGLSQVVLRDLLQKAGEVDQKLKQHIEAIGEAKDLIQQRLNPAMPALEDALKALTNLRKQDVCELRAFSKPPSAV